MESPTEGALAPLGVGGRAWRLETGRVRHAVAAQRVGVADMIEQSRRDLDNEGIESLVLLKMADGSWKIRHSHTSGRPRKPAQ